MPRASAIARGAAQPDCRRGAFGHKGTFSEVIAMSALPPKADIAERECHVRFVPKADILRCSKNSRLGQMLTKFR